MARLLAPIYLLVFVLVGCRPALPFFMPGRIFVQDARRGVGAMCYGRGRAPGVMGLVALRISKDKKPEKDDRFMLPKSRFDDTFEPYNRFGTYVAEMTALDKLEEKEAKEGEKLSNMRVDRKGDVTRGIHIETEVPEKKQWNRRSAAARLSWEEPGFRKRMLQQRASKRQGDLSPTTPPGDAVDAPRPGGKAGGADGGGAVAGETGIQLMRRDQNRWMEQRLTSRSASGAPPPSPSSAEKGDTAMLRARAWRQEKQARAKQRAEARQEEAAAAEGLPLLLESLGLGDHAPALAARNATLAHLRRIRPPAKTARVFQQSGLHPKEVARLVKAVKGRTDLEVLEECRREARRQAQREYMRRYRQERRPTGTGKAAGKARESAAARQQNGARTPAAKLVGAGRKAIGLLDPAGEQEAAEEGDAGDGSAEDEGS